MQMKSIEAQLSNQHVQAASLQRDLEAAHAQVCSSPFCDTKICHQQMVTLAQSKHYRLGATYVM